jgi:2-polyprenyl-6-methoxyphenol hydroxylase-like FAD-dependent oxidoreductase
LSTPGRERISATCCIAGGGPAGMMLAFLLARRGVRVIVLEKHADFLRDFRGDTLHPSTLEVMHELRLATALLERPHQKVDRLVAQVGDLDVEVADFRHLPVHYPFIALMPQWDFLDFVLQHGLLQPTFSHRMNAEVHDVVERDGRIVGVLATTPDGELEVEADLVVAADGRRSTLRTRAGLEVGELGSPIDVFWFRLSRKPGDPELTGGRFDPGGIFVRIFRGDYWQCGYVIPKGAAEAIRARGIEAFRARIVAMLPVFADRVGELASFNDIKLLTVAIDRLKRWHRPGLLCIGDAAHAMSPVGGVGINLAIQDAVATANMLAETLLTGRVGEESLASVQRRREFPTRVTQRMQLIVQERILTPALSASAPLSPPLFLRLLARWPLLRRLPARVVGMGIRPEHVRAG